MNFQEAEREYQDLRAQYSAGKLSNSDFEAQVSKLKVQDAEGRWWQIGVQSGDWYVHDGQKWSKSRPPAPGSNPPQPVPTPEVAKPAPAGGTVAASAAPPPKSTGKSGVTPRLFSAAPAGRGGGGLPTPALIGIVAVVALVAIGIIIAAFLLLSGQLGGTNTASATKPAPTVVVVAPTVGLPTIPPAPPTNAPVILPTLPVLVAPTAVLTTTAPVTATAVSTTTRPTTTTAGGPTATRRPVTPTVAAPKVAPTATPNLKPGIYVTGLRTTPAQPNPGDAVTFYVNFFNNSGDTGPTPWIVKIFRCEALCTPDELAVNKSIGETPKINVGVPVGTKELSAGPWTLGAGSCNLVASPYYIDPSTGQVVPYLPTTGQDRFYFNFKGCH